MKRSLTEDEINNILSFITPRKGIPIETAKSIANTQKKVLQNQLAKQLVYPQIIPSLKTKLEEIYSQSLIQAGESVGILCAQSIGEKNTQLTLNSFEWNTEILLKYKNGSVERHKIGDFIDKKLEDIKIEEYPNDTKLGWINDLEIEILSSDKNGNITWKNIEAITRHPVINKDGSNTLLKVCTESGREVIATKAKSFLKRINNELVSVNGADLIIGDYLPVSTILPITNTITHWKIDKYLPIDTCCVYENSILFDNLFGFFIGAYLAERCLSCQSDKILLSNIDDDFNKRIQEFCQQYSVKYQNEDVELKILCVECFVMTQLLINSIGKELKIKRVPVEFLNASDDFLKGIIDAYFSVHGFIDNTSIYISGISKGLLEDIQQILCKFEIKCKIKPLYNATISYLLSIDTNNAIIFKKNFNLTLKHKQKRLDKIGSSKNIYLNTDIIPDVITKEFGKISIKRSTIDTYISQCTNEQDKDVFMSIKNENIFYDQIISITEVQNMYPYAYDFTVSETRNFNLYNGLLVHDTFHKAGQSEKAVTAGVPRFQELLNATRDPRAINCKVFFKYGNNTIQQLRETIRSSIVGLTLSDISSNITIYMNKEPEKWYETYKILYDKDFTNYKNCISIKLNTAKLFEYKLTIEEVADTITKSYGDLYCVFSPPSIGQLDVFVDTSNINLPAERILFINTENAAEIYIEECVQPTLEKMLICGIPGITYIYYTCENNEWIVETEGSNYSKILAHPIVDMTKTISNNVWDIYETLGIEAARQFLIEEFMEIMDGINVCHTKLLVDRMTFSGTIASISRYTLRKEDSGPFGKSSFEESLSNFCAAAAVGDLEPVRGVSSAIVCGKRANIGSGMCELKINVKGLKKVVERSFE